MTSNPTRGQGKPSVSNTPTGKAPLARKRTSDEFMPMPRKKSFNQKKNVVAKLVASFYSLLEKPDNSDKDEEFLDNT